MIEQYKLSDYDLYIKQEVKDTETSIKSVKDIIEKKKRILQLASNPLKYF